MTPATIQTADLSNVSDAELLSRAAGTGDRSAAAWRELHERYNDKLNNYLRGHYGFSDAVSEDIVSVVWSRAYRHAHKFDGDRSALSTWLHTITKRLAANRLRDEGRDPTTPVSEIERRRSYNWDRALMADSASPDPNPAERFELAELERNVRAAIEELPEPYRGTMRLRLEGEGYQEISDISGAKLGTVKSRLNRARNRLKKLLADRGVDLSRYLQVNGRDGGT